MATLHLGQWEWFTGLGKPHWRAPGGDALGALDFRSLSQSALAGGIPQGFGFFVYASPKPGLINLGDRLNRLLTALEKQALNTRFGVSLAASTLLDALWELFNVWADPTDQSKWKPLLPQVDGELVLRLGGFSAIREDDYRHDRYPLALQVVKHDWERLERECVEAKTQLDGEGLTWERVQAQCAGLRALKRTDPQVVQSPEWARLHRLAVLSEPDHHRRVLQALCEQYRLTPKEFETIWARTLPSLLPPGTIITENWNCADSDSLNCNLTWTELNGDCDIVSNEFNGIGQTYDIARADSDLEADDHRAQLRITSITSVYLGPLCRKDSTAALTYYMAVVDTIATPDLWRTFKRLNPTATVIGTNTSVNAALDDILRVEADGSTIRRLRNGSIQDSATDTAITGNLRCGVESYDDATYGTPKCDDFEAADLAVARRRVGFGAGQAIRM